MKKIKCNVCGVEFIPESKEHYISRDVGIENSVSKLFISNNEPKIYDTFDCPQCGCQVMIGERKRKMTILAYKESGDDSESETK